MYCTRCNLLLMFEIIVIFPFVNVIFWCCPPLVEEYERSWEQNEELGLNDIDTSSADAAYGSRDTTV